MCVDIQETFFAILLNNVKRCRERNGFVIKLILIVLQIKKSSIFAELNRLHYD